MSTQTTYTFERGFPSGDTAQKAYDDNDLNRAIEAYKFFYPTVSGHENQWIKTIPDKGWFVYFRVYGPEQAAFDGSWKPGDFEEVK